MVALKAPKRTYFDATGKNKTKRISALSGLGLEEESERETISEPLS